MVMSTAKAAILDSISKRRLRGLPSRMRMRKPMPSERLEKIKEMATALLDEAATLNHENALTEANATIGNLIPSSRVDFFKEVKSFEMRLIQRALELTVGNTAGPARSPPPGTAN